MTTALEAQLETLVHQPFAIQPIGQASLTEQIDGALLEKAGSDALLDVFPAAPLDHDRLYALQGEQM